MSMARCARCGRTDPQRMIALMTPWFGGFIDLAPEPSYFHVCPGCWAEAIEPHAERAMEKLWEMHPGARGVRPEEG